MMTSEGFDPNSLTNVREDVLPRIAGGRKAGGSDFPELGDRDGLILHLGSPVHAGTVTVLGNETLAELDKAHGWLHGDNDPEDF